MEQAVYIKRAQEGDEEAFCILIRENSALVHHIAGRFEGRGVEREDLYQIGALGLVKAIKGFDLTRGYCFSTYAVPVIVGEIKQYIRADSQMKISREIVRKRGVIGKITHEFEISRGRTPMLSEIVDNTGFSEEEIIFAMESMLPLESLNEPIGEEGERQDFIALERNDYDALVDRVTLQNALDDLHQQDRQLLYYRYFLNLTQSKTAAILGISQGQVCRQEKKVLQNLRTRM